MRGRKGPFSAAADAPDEAQDDADSAARERTEADVRVDLAAAYRRCAQRGWDETIYTHLSAAEPGEPGAYLINAFGMRFDEVTASSLVEGDTQGRVTAMAAGAGRIRVVPDEIAEHTRQQWVGDGRELDGDAEWPALLRGLERSSPGFRA